MIGGGFGAFIGSIHRMVAIMDGDIELVCGCFSSDVEKSKASGARLHLDPSRVYNNYEEMILKEIYQSHNFTMKLNRSAII